MRILYLSVHSVLEYDEVLLFTELGHDVFSWGAYTYPQGHPTLPRPGIPGLQFHADLADLSRRFPRTEMPQELIDWADLIIIMDGAGMHDVIELNWDKLKAKKVIWRTIGQSTPSVENRLRRYRNEGLKIVRYSPMEDKLKNYIGGDVTIRFYKDPTEFSGYNGKEPKIVNFTQTLKGRRIFCGYDPIMKLIEGFPAKVYGSGNEDLGEYNGGELPYDLMKGALRDNRVYVYRGTWPASYTLTTIEAMMTGIPVVSTGPEIGNMGGREGIDTYEMQHIIKNNESGFVSDDLDYLRTCIKSLLNDLDLARKIGDAGRKRAIELFSKEVIRSQWSTFFDSLA